MQESSKLKEKLGAVQRKVVQFVLSRPSRSHVGQQEFEALGWLPFGDRQTDSPAGLAVFV
jgi:hypothetical protein